MPYVIFSWPVKLDLAYVTFISGSLIQTIQYALLIVVSVIVIYLLYRGKKNYTIPVIATSYAFIVMLLPMGIRTVMVIAVYLGIVLFLAMMIISAYCDEKPLDRFMALAVFIFVLFFQSIALYMISDKNPEFRVAYGIGFVIFCIIAFFISQGAKFFMRYQDDYSPRFLSGTCALLSYLWLYSISGRLSVQESIFNADRIVIVMVVLFTIMAISLFIVLYLMREEKIILFLAASVFIMMIVVLLLTGKNLSWAAYAIIFNILLLFMEGTLIFYSTKIASRLLANLSIGAFVLHVMTRYFDIFWDMISGSFLFLITGVVLLGGGYFLEKNRRLLMGKISEASAVQDGTDGGRA